MICFWLILLPQHDHRVVILVHWYISFSSKASNLYHRSCIQTLPSLKVHTSQRATLHLPFPLLLQNSPSTTTLLLPSTPRRSFQLSPNTQSPYQTATTLNPQSSATSTLQSTHLAQRTQTALPVYHLLIHLPIHSFRPRNPPSHHNYDHSANTTATTALTMTPPLHPPFTGWFCHLCSSINPPVAWNAGTTYQPRCMVR